MNTFFKIACSLLFFCFGYSISPAYTQDQEAADSLAKIYQRDTLTDADRLELLRQLSFNEMRDLDQGLKYADELIRLSERTANERYQRIGYYLRGTKNRALGNHEKALKDYFKSAAIARKLKHKTGEGECYGAIGDTYSVGGNHQTAMQYYYKGIAMLRKSNDSISLASAISNTGDAFLKVKQYDSALFYFKEAKAIFERKQHESGIGYSLGNFGMVYASTGQSSLAEGNINEAIRILENVQDYYPICDYLLSMADIYHKKNDDQSALSYALRSLRLAQQYGLKQEVANASLKLSELYERLGDTGTAFMHYKRHIAIRDSITNIATVQRMGNLRIEHELSQKQKEVNLLNQQKQNEKNLTILLGIILGLTVIILAILLRNNQNKQRAYKVLNRQKQETDEQKAKAEDALVELQVTQKQLIQSAKMASLGELTAGIAHEIQNPLNFVNNFSELSLEQLAELREITESTLLSSDKPEAEEIVNSLENNLRKINDHGKRAESIVKGMLQHSRASTGKKEPTPINVLADEYLRLSYQGLRAKDKDFTATFSSHYDDSIGSLDLVPQDIGRVLLNLYNNAFYSVKEKKKQLNGTYEPCVRVTTRRVGNKVELAVKDNGNGISQKVLDKIFQPFFTTKPSGQGTGLGLSLSYDVIKAHGGEIKVETREGEFAEFIIQLPIPKANGGQGSRLTNTHERK